MGTAVTTAYAYDLDIAQQSDINGIQQAALESWHAAYMHIFSPDLIDTYLYRSYSAEALSKEIASARTLFYVAREGERVVGFAQCSTLESGAQLNRQYVLPTHWRQGIGSKLVRTIEFRLTDLGVRFYFCYVHKNNDLARQFYRKCGFLNDRTRDRNDEVYMIKPLPRI